MTTTDSRVLSHHQPLFENKVCKVEFKQEISGGFGNAYSFSLGDAVKDCQEFVVPLEEVSALAAQYGFEMCLSQNLADFVHEKAPSYINMMHNMSVIGRKAESRGPLTLDEWQAIELYQVLVFRRVLT